MLVALGDRSKYPGGYYPNEVDKGFGSPSSGGASPAPAYILGTRHAPALTAYTQQAGGRGFPGAPLPPGISRGEPKQCFTNASKLVLGNPGLDYAEGWVESDAVPLAIFHGWAVDRATGAVVDNTLADPERQRYYGTVYPRDAYLSHLLETGVHGVLGGDRDAAKEVLKQGGLTPRPPTGLTYRAKLAYHLGDRSKYPGGYYPNEQEKGFGGAGSTAELTSAVDSTRATEAELEAKHAAHIAQGRPDDREGKRAWSKELSDIRRELRTAEANREEAEVALAYSPDAINGFKVGEIEVTKPVIDDVSDRLGLSVPKLGKPMITDGVMRECQENARREYHAQKAAGNNPTLVRGVLIGMDRAKLRNAQDAHREGAARFDSFIDTTRTYPTDHVWVEVGGKVIDATPFQEQVLPHGRIASSSAADHWVTAAYEPVTRVTAENDHVLDKPLATPYEINQRLKLSYRQRLALLLGDRSKYPSGYYPNEEDKGFGGEVHWRDRLNQSASGGTEEARRAVSAAQDKSILDAQAYDEERQLDPKDTLYGEFGVDSHPAYVEEVNARLGKALKNAKIFVRTTSGTLQKILSSGEVKNTFQTGTSSGGTDAKGSIAYQRRREVEEKLFGIPQEASPEDRPKYGYLSSGDGITEMRPGMLRGAGTVAIEFKPEVRERTTFTVGDSLDEAVTLWPEGLGGGWTKKGDFIPQPVNKPNILAVPNGTKMEPNKSGKAEKLSRDYTEAQLHGKVRASDIASVTFEKKPGTALASRLKKLGIGVKVAKGTPYKKPAWLSADRVRLVLPYRARLAFLLGDRSKYPGGYYPNEVAKGFGGERAPGAGAGSSPERTAALTKTVKEGMAGAGLVHTWDSKSPPIEMQDMSVADRLTVLQAAGNPDLYFHTGRYSTRSADYDAFQKEAKDGQWSNERILKEALDRGLVSTKNEDGFTRPLGASAPLKGTWENVPSEHRAAMTTGYVEILKNSSHNAHSPDPETLKRHGWTTPEIEHMADALDGAGADGAAPHRPSDIMAPDKPIDRVATNFGFYSKNYDNFEANMLNGWAIASGTATAVVVRDVAAVAFPPPAGATFYDPDQGESAWSPRAVEHLRTMKANTEQWFRDNLRGKSEAKLDKPITLYRGIGQHVDAYTPAAMESWTSDTRTVDRFGEMMSGNDGAYSALKTSVTYRDVLWTYQTVKGRPGWPPDQQLQGKKEWVLLGKSVKSVAVDRRMTPAGLERKERLERKGRREASRFADMRKHSGITVAAAKAAASMADIEERRRTGRW